MPGNENIQQPNAKYQPISLVDPSKAMQQGGGCSARSCAGFCAGVVAAGCVMLVFALIPVGPDPNVDSYSSSFLGFSLNGNVFTFGNYVQPLLDFPTAAASSTWRIDLARWFDGFAQNDPLVGRGVGPNSVMYYSFSKVREQLEDIGPAISGNRMKRESELALVYFNNLMWPEAGRFTLGLPNEDHAIVRPYLADMFDDSFGATWNPSILRSMFRAEFAQVDLIENDNTAGHRFVHDLTSPTRTKSYITQVTLRVLHRIALGINLTKDESVELAAMQSALLVVATLPGRLAQGMLVWKLVGKPFLLKRQHYIEIYKAAIVNRWSSNKWAPRKLDLVASAFFDAIMAAGGRSVPLAIDVVMGYILTKNKPTGIVGVDFSEERNIRSLMIEAMRYHPPVTTLPRWISDDNGSTWLHEGICLDRACADPTVFPDPDSFILNRPGLRSEDLGNASRSIAWGDFALVDGKNNHPNSHACPGKQLSISMVVAFVQEFQAAGPWQVESDDIVLNYYGTKGFKVTKTVPAKFDSQPKMQLHSQDVYN